jgi:hypothetical protein
MWKAPPFVAPPASTPVCIISLGNGFNIPSSLLLVLYFLCVGNPQSFYICFTEVFPSAFPVVGLLLRIRTYLSLPLGARGTTTIITIAFNIMAFSMTRPGRMQLLWNARWLMFGNPLQPSLLITHSLTSSGFPFISASYLWDSPNNRFLPSSYIAINAIPPAASTYLPRSRTSQYTIRYILEKQNGFILFNALLFHIS